MSARLRSASRRTRAASDTSSLQTDSTTSHPPAAADAFLYWQHRSLYPVPSPTTVHQIVLQNDLLCTFGGLGADCSDLLFRTVSENEAMIPSCAALYKRSCVSQHVEPQARILEQLSTTPGRYECTTLNVSGIPLGDSGIATLFPVLRANWHCLHSLQLRGTSLHVGDALDRLLWFLEDPTMQSHDSPNARSPSRRDDLFPAAHHAMTNLPPALTSLDLSGNLLTDAQVERIVQFFGRSATSGARSASRTIVRVQLQQNRASRRCLERVQSLIQRQTASPCLSLHSAATMTPSPPTGPVKTLSVPPRPPTGSASSAAHRPPSARLGSAGLQRPVKTLQELSRIEARHLAERGLAQAAGKPIPLVRQPVIPRHALFQSIDIYRRLMAQQTAILDLDTFRAEQPATFEVYCRQKNAQAVQSSAFLVASSRIHSAGSAAASMANGGPPNGLATPDSPPLASLPMSTATTSTSATTNQSSSSNPADCVILPSYLAACFPQHSMADVVHALAFFSEYSLTVPLRKQHTHHLSVRRDDNQEAVEHVFRLLDREGQGRIPRRLLCPEPVTEGDLRDLDVMIRRLRAAGGAASPNLDEVDEPLQSEVGRSSALQQEDDTVDLEAFSLIVGPYLRDARRRKRVR